MKNKFHPEIKSSDVLKTEYFWAWLVLGTGFAYMGIALLWSLFRIIFGYNPAWEYMDKETGNFIVFLAFIIAGFKSYKSKYDELSRKRQREIEKLREEYGVIG